MNGLRIRPIRLKTAPVKTQKVFSDAKFAMGGTNWY